jgi:16S rRNA A1518/A1519 N6-dimethyltransferase RsmA/KsgA/DIM1 with predicted DNA glycosylase/AP lyase activity
VRESFDPPPKVSSAVVVIRPRHLLSTDDLRLVKLLFSQRRRKLSGALKQLGLRSRRLDPGQLSKRVQDLSPSEFLEVLRLIERDV